MTPERPDLSQIDPAVRAYIEALETELETLRAKPAQRAPRPPAEPAAPSEPPTTMNVISISKSGLAKRTPRHHYSRQRRGGMGIFDIETAENDPPAIITIADAGAYLLLITSQARVFRVPVSHIPETEVRSRGLSLIDSLPFATGETLALVLPDGGGTYLAVAGQRGQVRTMGSHLFGERLKPGLQLFDTHKYGPPTAACWTPSSTDLFLATRQGLGIRFSLKQVSTQAQGSLGIRLEADDAVVGIGPVQQDSGVFMVTGDGKGTIRLMSKFRPNKTPGGGGKVAIKTDQLISAATVSDNDDIFLISRLGKMIRFQAHNVPAKEGVVQGVHCMALRADEVVALTVSD